MIEEPPVLTIATGLRRPSEEQIAAFRGVPTGFVFDALKGGGALSREIRHIGRESGLPLSVAGPALTVDCGPGDILALLGALNSIRSGDVVIAAVAGFQGCAAAGDRLCGMMRNNGAVGFVTDGPMRDFEGIVAAGLPAWCTGLTPASPYSKGPGSVGLPVQIGGQEVETGDIIVADGDGVMVVPYERIDEAIAALATVRELEHALDARVAEGLRIPAAIEELLASTAVRYLD